VKRKKSLVIIDEHRSIAEMLVWHLKNKQKLFSEAAVFSTINEIHPERHQELIGNSLILLQGYRYYNTEQAFKAIYRDFGDIPLILIDGRVRSTMVQLLIKYDLDGYLTFHDTLDELAEGIEQVLEGGKTLSQKVQQMVVFNGKQFELRAEYPDLLFFRLSYRERELLHHIVEGKNLEECSKLMGISPKSSDNLKTRLMQKLEVHSMRHLMLLGMKFKYGEDKSVLKNGDAANFVVKNKKSPAMDSGDCVKHVKQARPLTCYAEQTRRLRDT